MFRLLSSNRYTITITPHQTSHPKSFSLNLGSLLAVAVAWSLISVGGFLALTQSGVLLAKLGDAELYKARVKILAQKVNDMQVAYEGLTYLEEDMRYLLGMQESKDWQAALAKIGSAKPKRDTINDLLMGKITFQTMASLSQHSKRYNDEAKALIASVGGLMLDERNEAQKDYATPTSWPTYGRLTSRFGLRLSPFERFGDDPRMQLHRGLDIANAKGTPVRASASGVVRKAGWMGGFGRAVVLDHGYGYSTLYGHTSKIEVSEGDFISKGDIIAFMGSTG
ncbi:MAG: M23 family metallopeptidase, partial [Elusimicrobiota bacterium]